MYLGHINLERSMNGMGEHFVRLVEALDRQGLRQHVLVANAALGRRIAILENVQVGPIVHTVVMAYCLMPDVDVVHVHDAKSGPAGLVLRLTRSIPYVVTRREPAPPARNPVSRSVIGRAASIVCPTPEAEAAVAEFDVPIDSVRDICHQTSDEISQNRVAAEHHRIYRRAVDSRRIPVMLL